MPSIPNHADESDPFRDNVIEYYKLFVDRKKIRENLKLTPEERLRKLDAHMRDLEVIQAALAYAKSQRPERIDNN